MKKTERFCYDLLFMVLKEWLIHNKNYITYRRALNHFEITKNNFSMRLIAQKQLLEKLGLEIVYQPNSTEKYIWLNTDTFKKYIDTL